MAFEDDLDELRDKSFRASSAYGELEEEDFDTERRSSFLSRFTPVQRLILAFLVLLDIVVIGFVLFVIFGVIDLT